MRWPEYNQLAVAMDGKPIGYGMCVFAFIFDESNGLF